jgi:hypothetical protein
MKIRKQESNKDFWFYLTFYAVVGILKILFVWFVSWLVLSLVSDYQNALNNCMDNGYSQEYCIDILN